MAHTILDYKPTDSNKLTNNNVEMSNKYRTLIRFGSIDIVLVGVKFQNH